LPATNNKNTIATSQSRILILIVGLSDPDCRATEAAVAAITADLKCYLGWCWSRHPRIAAIPAAPETLVHYLRWLENPR
jgi:hypothetical protein